MRKLITLCIVALSLMISTDALAQFRYGPTAGVVYTDLTFKQNFLKVNPSVGGSAGIQAELMFPGVGFGIDFGLSYELRGAELNLGEWPMWYYQGYRNERMYLHYLNIPIHLRFKYTRLNGVEDKIAPLAYAGPSIALLMGHSKIDCMEYPFGSFGLDFGLGAEIYRNWQLVATYTWGLTYALKDKALTNFSARNGVIGVRLTYLF